MLGGPSGWTNGETAVSDETSGEHTRFWHVAELGGVESLHARYVEQRSVPHVHSSFALAIIEQGTQRFRHRGDEHLAPLGSMVLINPNEVHTGSKVHDAGWLYRGCYPEMEQIDGILDELEIHHGGVSRSADSMIHDRPLARVFVHLHRLLVEHVDSLETQTRWCETMLILFCRHARLPEAPKTGQEPLAVVHARELLVVRLLDPPSLEELAAAVNLSPFHFTRVFRRATGMPSHAWFRQRRLEQTRALFKSDRVPLEMALELDFVNQSHPGRQFKQVYGVVPGKCRSAYAHSSLTTHE